MQLTIELMEKHFADGGVDGEGVSGVGDKLLAWIDAYGKAVGSSRSCWVGEKKKLVCMTWRDADESDEDEVEEDDDDDDL